MRVVVLSRIGPSTSTSTSSQPSLQLSQNDAAIMSHSKSSRRAANAPPPVVYKWEDHTAYYPELRRLSRYASTDEREIAQMPEVRALLLKRNAVIGSLGKDRKSQNLAPTLAYLRGEANFPPCLHCTRFVGPFRECVSLKGHFDLACTNCAYNGHGDRCSFCPSTGNGTASQSPEVRQTPRERPLARDSEYMGGSSSSLASRATSKSQLHVRHSPPLPAFRNSHDSRQPNEGFELQGIVSPPQPPLPTKTNPVSHQAPDSDQRGSSSTVEGRPSERSAKLQMDFDTRPNKISLQNGGVVNDHELAGPRPGSGDLAPSGEDRSSSVKRNSSTAFDSRESPAANHQTVKSSQQKSTSTSSASPRRALATAANCPPSSAPLGSQTTNELTKTIYSRSPRKRDVNALSPRILQSPDPATESLNALSTGEPPSKKWKAEHDEPQLRMQNVATSNSLQNVAVRAPLMSQESSRITPGLWPSPQLVNPEQAVVKPLQQQTLCAAVNSTDAQPLVLNTEKQGLTRLIEESAVVNNARLNASQLFNKCGTQIDKDAPAKGIPVPEELEELPSIADVVASPTADRFESVDGTAPDAIPELPTEVVNISPPVSKYDTLLAEAMEMSAKQRQEELAALYLRVSILHEANSRAALS